MGAGSGASSGRRKLAPETENGLHGLRLPRLRWHIVGARACGAPHPCRHERASGAWRGRSASPQGGATSVCLTELQPRGGVRVRILRWGVPGLVGQGLPSLRGDWCEPSVLGEREVGDLRSYLRVHGPVRDHEGASPQLERDAGCWRPTGWRKERNWSCLDCLNSPVELTGGGVSRLRVTHGGVLTVRHDRSARSTAGPRSWVL